MPTTRHTIEQYENQGGLSVSGLHHLQPEGTYWRMDDIERNFDGSLRRRRALQQWGQILKTPNYPACSVGMTEALDHLNNFIVDAFGSAALIEKLPTSIRLFGTTTTPDDYYILTRSYMGPEVPSTASEASVRFLFRQGSSLPAGPPTGSTSLPRGAWVNIFVYDGANYEARFIVFCSDGIYYSHNSTWILVTGSAAAVNDGRWHTIEFRARAGAVQRITIRVDDVTLLDNVTSLANFSTAAQRAFEIGAVSHETTAFDCYIDHIMFADGAQTVAPFANSKVRNIFDWRGNQQLSGPMVHADGAIWEDIGFEGAWRMLKTTRGQDVTFTSFKEEVIIIEKDEIPYRWDGISTPRQLEGGPPRAHFGGEFLSRLWLFGTSDNPLRGYYSAINNIDSWNVDGSGDPTLSGYMSVPDRRSSKISAVFGNYFGEMVVWTDVQPWRIEFDNALIPFLSSLPATHGCVGPNAVTAVGNDIWYVSKVGIHSIAATDKYGDMTINSVSKTIRNFWATQPESEARADPNALVRAQLDYSGTDESVAFVFPEMIFDTVTEFRVLFFDLDTGSWYGPHYSGAISASRVNFDPLNKTVLMFGGATGLVSYIGVDGGRDQNGLGPNCLLKTSRITGKSIDPKIAERHKRFSELRLWISPRNNQTLTLKYATDESPPKTVTFDPNLYKAKVLGEFIVGQDVVSSAHAVAPKSIHLDAEGQSLWWSLESENDFLLQGWALDIEIGDTVREVA